MGTKRILIIDDELDFSQLMKIHFEKMHCKVILTHSLQEGLAVLKEFNPHFIFLDNQLPDGTGWAEARFILQNYPKCRLTLMSGYVVPKTSSRSFNILEKPVIFSDLEAIVNEGRIVHRKENDAD